MTRNRSSRRSKYTAAQVFFLTLIVAGGCYLFFLIASEPQSPQASHVPVQVEPTQQEILTALRPVKLEPGPFQIEMDRLSDLIRSSEKFGKGESLSKVLERLGLDAAESYLISEAASEVMDLTKAMPGDQVVVYREHKTRQPVRLEYNRPGMPKVLLLNTPAGYAATKMEYAPIQAKGACSGDIRNSLWGSAVNLHGLDPELVMEFADIFRYDVDFVTDVREGDRFSLLYQNNYCQGKKVGNGRVLAASFVNKNQRFEAYFWCDGQGNSGYYDANGESLQKLFLKSPLQYRRISSHFSNSRKHPILKIVRPHLGVDYAAPTGTPVESIGAGKVVYKGKKGGYGNLIIVEHSKTYTTMYAHLSKFAKGLKVGQKVGQGELIGYVGMTGLATGPHLDFRVKENGNFIDPLSVKLKPAPPIDPKDKKKFKEMVAKYKTEMSHFMASAE